MRTHRQGRLDRDIAEQLLSGAPGPGHAELDGLIARLTAPVKDTEATGEDAALAAFQQAGEPEAHRISKVRSVLVAHAVAVACACILVGGAALATVAGSVPIPVAEEPTPRPTQDPDGGPAVRHVPTTPPDENLESGGPAGPDFAGLCREYTARVAADPARALEHPSAKPLIHAAGGREKVKAFCATELEPEPAPEALKQHGRPSPHYYQPRTGTPPSGAGVRPGGGPWHPPHAHPPGPRYGKRHGYYGHRHPGMGGHGRPGPPRGPRQ